MSRVPSRSAPLGWKPAAESTSIVFGLAPAPIAAGELRLLRARDALLVRDALRERDHRSGARGEDVGALVEAEVVRVDLPDVVEVVAEEALVALRDVALADLGGVERHLVRRRALRLIADVRRARERREGAVLRRSLLLEEEPVHRREDALRDRPPHLVLDRVGVRVARDPLAEQRADEPAESADSGAEQKRPEEDQLEQRREARRVLHQPPVLALEREQEQVLEAERDDVPNGVELAAVPWVRCRRGVVVRERDHREEQVAGELREVPPRQHLDVVGDGQRQPHPGFPP